jgi:hypothetical protein
VKSLLTGAKGLVGSTIDAEIRLDGRSQLDLRDWAKTHKFFYSPTNGCTEGGIFFVHLYLS